MNRFNRRAILLVLTGLLASVAAAVVVYFLVSRTSTPTGPVVTVAPTPVPGKVVLVAATDILASSAITRSHLITASFPVDLVPADAITDANQVLGLTARTAVFSGQILLQRQFIAGGGTNTTSENIPPGKVLVAFPSTDMLNATGAVQRGDFVDIMLSIPISGTTRLDAGTGTGSQLSGGEAAMVTQGTLQNVQVSSIGTWTPPGQDPNNANNANQAVKIITFVVDHQEALILKFVKDSGGTIDLVVRSAADKNTVTTDPVTIDYLVDAYNFIGLAQPSAPQGAAAPAPDPAAPAPAPAP